MSQVNIMSQEKKMSDKLGQDCIFLLLERKDQEKRLSLSISLLNIKKKKSPVNSLAAQEAPTEAIPAR